MFTAIGVRIVKTPVQAPRANAIAEPAQVIKIVPGEREILQKAQAVLQAGGDKETHGRRQPPDEQGERRRACHRPAQTARRHVQLVQIGEKPTRYDAASLHVHPHVCARTTSARRASTGFLIPL